MDRITVKTTGFAELSQLLGNLSRATSKNTAKRALLQAAEPIAHTAERLAPDDLLTGEGDLHSSIKATVRPRTRKTVWVDVAPFQPLEKSSTGKYTGRRVAAVGFELGTNQTPMHPFMRPAFEAEKGNALQTIKSFLRIEITKSIARAAKKGKL